MIPVLLPVLLFTAPQAPSPSPAEIAALVARWDEDTSPGGVLAVLADGAPPIVHAFGMADLEGGRKATRATPFYLASHAKQFTAACVVHAAAAGKLALDDALTRRVPGLPESWGAITLRHLIHQRSGVKDVYEVVLALDLGRDPLASNAAAVRLLARLPGLDFTPGERCTYSNSGYVLLAEALREATGTSLAEYARKHVFDPLGMAQAHYGSEPGERSKDRAKSYRATEGGWAPMEVVTGLTGPGGLWASADDLVQWERAWLAGTWADARVRAELLAPPALAKGASLHPRFGRYAGGVRLQTRSGLPVVRHGGGAFGFSADILRFPEEKVSVLALSNAADLNALDLAEEAADLVLRAKMRAPPKEEGALELDAGQLARLGRMWRDERSGIAWILTLRPGRMVVATLGDWKLELAARTPNRLVSVGTEVPVTLDFAPAEGPAERLSVSVGDVTIAACKLLPFPPRDLPPAADYAGAYRMPALSATLRIRTEGGKLRIEQPRALFPTAPFVLPEFHPLGADVFVCDAGFQMTFGRDAEGRVDRLRIDASRARGLELVRE